MIRAAVLAVVLALVAAAPAAAPAAAARKACVKRVACKGKASALRRGIPLRWTGHAALPGTGGAPGNGAPGKPAPGTGTPGKPAPPPPPPPPPPADDPRFVQVTAGDSDPERWTLTLSRSTLLAGTVGVEFNNRYAEDPHDLWIRRGGTTFRFDPVDAGAAVTKELDLAAGSWKLWCEIGDHEARGMVAQITVTAG